MAVLESIQATKTRELVATFMTQVYVWMSFGLVVTGGIAWYVASSEVIMETLKNNGIALLLLIVAQFGLVLYLSARAATLSPAVASGFFVLYAALTGITLAPIFLLYTSESIASAFLVTGGMFGGMSLYGRVTKRDLSGMGSLMVMALWGIIIASVVNWFLRSDSLMWALTYISVVVFVGLTAYNTQRIKNMALQLDSGNEDLRGSMAVVGALILYLNFLNLFLSILRIMGRRR